MGGWRWPCLWSNEKGCIPPAVGLASSAPGWAAGRRQAIARAQPALQNIRQNPWTAGPSRPSTVRVAADFLGARAAAPPRKLARLQSRLLPLAGSQVVIIVEQCVLIWGRIFGGFSQWGMQRARRWPSTARREPAARIPNERGDSRPWQTWRWRRRPETWPGGWDGLRGNKSERVLG